MATATDKKYVLGSVTIELDPEKLIETVEGLAKLDNKSLQTIADALEVPSSPFEKRLLMPVVQGAVQNEWYKRFTPSVPDKCILNQADRVTRYKALIQAIKENDGKDVVLTRRKPASSSNGTASRQSATYRLVEATKEVWSKFKGQKRLIIRAFEELKAGPGGVGVTVKTISETVRDTEETVAPSDKNCAFHINAFGHENIVERVEQKDGQWVVAEVQKPKSAEQPAKTESKPEPKKEEKKSAAPAKDAGKKPSKK